MKRCIKCGKTTEDMHTTAYGETRCEDCYFDYLSTNRSEVEYFIGLAKGDYPISDFDADYLGHIVLCWNKYRNELALTLYEINEIEEKARLVGLL